MDPDALRGVRHRLEALARRSTHGGYAAAMSSDPVLLSRAIFEWWWVDAGNAAAYRANGAKAVADGPAAHGSAGSANAPPPPQPQPTTTQPRLRAEEVVEAARALQVDPTELDMDNIRIEDMIAHRPPLPVADQVRLSRLPCAKMLGTGITATGGIVARVLAHGNGTAWPLSWSTSRRMGVLKCCWRFAGAAALVAAGLLMRQSDAGLFTRSS